MYSSVEDTIGDMQASILVKSLIPGFEVSRKFHINIPEHLYITEEEVGEYLFIPASLKRDREMALFLSKFDAQEQGDFYIVKLSSQDYPEMTIFRDLVKIPSAILDYKAMECGYHKFQFTFNRHDIHEVSEFIFHSREKIPTLEAEYLGRSRGFNWILERASSVEPLLSLEVSISVPEANLATMGPLRYRKWIRRPRFNGSTDFVDALYRIDDTDGLETIPNFHRISPDDNIYRVVTGTELAVLNDSRIMKNFNPLLYQQHEFDGKTLKIRGIVSQNYSSSLMSSISDASRAFPEWHISLTRAEFVSTSESGHILPQVINEDVEL